MCIRDSTRTGPSRARGRFSGSPRIQKHREDRWLSAHVVPEVPGREPHLAGGPPLVRTAGHVSQ
eukprot:2517029-Pyramimonas_sp.AAC.1